MDPEDLVARLRAAGCVFAEEEARLLMDAAADDNQLQDMTGRRIAGEPLEHVVGWAQFCGLRIQLDPGVFRPRPRTEFLVEHAAALVGADPTAAPSGRHNGAQLIEDGGDLPVEQARVGHGRDNGGGGTERVGGHGGHGGNVGAGRLGTVVVDLCCGSGALGVALATMLSDVELHATDVDPVAVACARRNVEPRGGQVHLGDLFEALPTRLRGRVDVLLANVPYVPTGDLELMPAEARLHEPVGTLDGGPDGLDVLRRVAADAPRWLAPGGHLLTEASVRQAEAAAGVISSAGLNSSVVTSDEHDATVVVGSARS